MWGHLFVAVVDSVSSSRCSWVCVAIRRREVIYEKSMNEFDGILGASKGDYLDLYPVLYHTAYVSMYLTH